MDGEPRGYCLLLARVDPAVGARGPEVGVDAQEGVEVAQQTVGEEVDVLQKADEDLLLRVEGAPVLQRARVLRAKTGAAGVEAPVELSVRDLLYGLAPNPGPHVHRRPGPLQGAAHDEYDLGVGHDLVHVGDLGPAEDGVVGRCLPGDLAPAGREEGGVPVVAGPTEEVPEVPPEVFGERSLRHPPQPGLCLTAPAFVHGPVPAEPPQVAALLLYLLVEVVELLLLGHPDARVRLEVVVQPGRASLLRPYPYEVREHRSDPRGRQVAAWMAESGPL